MTPEQMKAIHDEHVGAENRQDLEAAVATYHDDCFYENVPLGMRVEGKEAVTGYYQAVFSAIPDVVLDITSEAYGRDTMVTFGTFSGTLDGSFAGQPPTGRRVEVPAVAVYTFRDGRMRSEQLYFDLATLCDQGGLDIAKVREAVGLGAR